MESLTAANSEYKQEMERWIRVLSSFDRVSFDQPYDLQPQRLLLAALPKKYYVDCLLIFNREFDRTYYLRKLVPTIMETFDPALCPTPLHFETFIVNRTLQLADGLYRMIWNSTTADERLVLYQLAADGWVNPLNRVAMAHLVRKRLIFFSATAGELKERGPLELMNESFRRFILAVQDPDEVQSWESDDQGILWRGMRLGLMTALVLAAAWISYIHRDWFDASAFAAPPQYVFGNSGRNVLVGPGTKQIDFSLFKSFAFNESRRLEFRAEAFNISNTPQFNNPNSSIGFAGVARITSAGSPTVYQRTSRQVQVALKLYF